MWCQDVKYVQGIPGESLCKLYKRLLNTMLYT